MNFRNIHTQNVFKIASQSSYVHIVATIDHIHASLSKERLNLFQQLINSIVFSLESAEFDEFPMDLVRCSYVVGIR